MPIDSSIRREQLMKLAASLEALCKLLQLDSQCTWTKHFQACLAATQALLASGFDQAALHDLSSAIRRVFAGMGSFNDYVPITTTSEFSAWSQQFGDPEKVIGAVYGQAMDLIAVGPLNQGCFEPRG